MDICVVSEKKLDGKVTLNLKLSFREEKSKRKAKKVR